MKTPPQYDPKFEKLLEYMKMHRGFDFTGYKRSSLERRINQRMQLLGVQDYDSYIETLEANPDEFVHLFNLILINVTAFLRDPEAWEYIADHILPKIIEQKVPAAPIRIWSAGVASGEEAYSIAMLLAEQLGLEGFKERVKIYATDMDEDALSKARQARYTAREIENIPEHLREKYFEGSGGSYFFHKELRRRVIFGRHNLILNAPISHIDLLLCRNILMYFNVDTQARVLSRIHFSLNDDGYLFLGKAEMLLTYGNMFTPVELKHRIFSKVNRVSPRERISTMHNERIEPEPEGFVYMMPKIREAASDTNPIAQIAIDANGTLVLANERARFLFNLSVNDIGRPIQDLKLSYQPIDLRSLIDEAKTLTEPKIIKDAAWSDAQQNDRFYDISVVALHDERRKLIGVSLSFIDVSTQKRLYKQLEHSKQDLETAMEELESTNEELETTNEELQSTIEELETTNEELQATNEELETLNEELQATNEELETLNNEMTMRTDEVNDVNAYLNSILASFSSSIVVVNKDYLVEVWNPKSEDLWGVRKQEVFGQSFFSLDIGLPVDELKRSIRAILAGDSREEKISISAINRRGQKIELQGNITPLNSRPRGISGAILILEPCGPTIDGGQAAPAQSMPEA
jgi:two-component system, chemotaxis family, CheB/CheR fusion protein